MMKIRKMNIEDYDEVYKLWASTGIQLKKSDEREEIEKMINHNPDTCLVGEKDGKIISAVMGGFDGRRGMIHHLAVSPAYQGRGFGKILLEKLELCFKKLGVIKTNLFVAASNDQVVGFYNKLGYVKREELITMSKTLLEEW